MSDFNYSITGLCDLLEHATNLSLFLSSDTSKCDSEAISLLQANLHGLLEESSSYALLLRSGVFPLDADSPDKLRAPTGAQ